MRPIVDNAKAASWTEHSNCFGECLAPLIGVSDVVDRQIAHDEVERRGRKRQAPSVGVDYLHTVTYAFCDGIALCCPRRVPRLVYTPPDVRTDRPAAGQALGREHEHGASPTAHVKDLFVTSQVQLVEQLGP